ncbi:MAG: hypothetical protein ACTSRI_03690 [Promethearchaeota archaeon]
MIDPSSPFSKAFSGHERIHGASSHFWQLRAILKIGSIRTL